jgi:hypothetical protein
MVACPGGHPGSLERGESNPLLTSVGVEVTVAVTSTPREVASSFSWLLKTSLDRFTSDPTAMLIIHGPGQ